MAKSKTKAAATKAKPAPKRAAPAKQPPTVAKSRFSAALRGALSQGQPGNWASDHRAEAEHFTGWNYVARNGIAILCSQADVAVYDDEQANAKYRRRLKAYGADAARDSEPLTDDHPMVRLMSRPNPHQSGASFRYEAAVQLMTGTCLIWNVPNRAGLTCQRFIIPTGIAMPREPSPDFPAGAYYISPEGARMRGDAQGFIEMTGYRLALGGFIDARQIQVVRWPHPLYRDDGYGPLAAGALWTDSADQIDKSRWAHLKNGVDPSVLITMPENVDLDDTGMDRAAAKINAKYGGAENTGHAMLMTYGTTAIKLGQTPEEMAYTEGWDQLKEAILALHGWPKALVDAGSYAQLYAALKQAIMFAVQPVLNLLAEEDSEQLAPQFGERLTVEMLAQPINDEELLERQLATDIAAGAIEVDEVRSIRGRPQWGGAKGGRVAGGMTLPVQAQQPGAMPRRDEQAKPIQAAPQAAEDTQAQNLVASDRLNGAQITAAITVLDGVTAGKTSPLVAVELLVALGIDEATAKRMVNASAALTPPEHGEPATNGFAAKHYNRLNGHKPSPALLGAIRGFEAVRKRYP